MMRILSILALLVVLGTAPAPAQRVSISLQVIDPRFSGHVVIGRPYHRRYSRGRYYHYRSRPVIVVVPRRVYRQRPPRVIVVKPRKHYRRHDDDD